MKPLARISLKGLFLLGLIFLFGCGGESPTGPSGRVQFKEPAGNGVSVNGSVSIQEGPYTGSPLIHLLLSASGATSMKVSEEPAFAGVSPIPFASTLPWTLSAEEGNKIIYVKFLDDAGNETEPVSATVVLDTILPTAPEIFQRDQITAQSAFEITLSRPATDANFQTYELKGGQYADWTQTAETVTFAFVLGQQGANVLSIRGRDLAGNVGDAASVTVTLDSTNPVLQVAVTPLGVSAAVLWNSDQPTTGHVDYGPDAGYGSTQSDPFPDTRHKVVLTGLSQSTVYHFRVTAADSAGNVTTSADLTFKTRKTVRGFIASDWTWTEAEGPYQIETEVVILPGVTLKIEPGVRVEYIDRNSIFTVKGAIVANGTAAQPIRFATVPVLSQFGGPYLLRFDSADLTRSNLRYVITEKNNAIQIWGISNGDGRCDHVTENHGILTISKSIITGDINTVECSTDASDTNGLIVSDSIIAGNWINVEPSSPKITVKNSSLNSTKVYVDRFNGRGISIQQSRLTDAHFFISIKGGLVKLEETTATSTTFDQLDNIPPVPGNNLEIASGSVFSNSSIYMPHGAVSLSDMSVIYNEDFPEQRLGIPRAFIVLGDGKLDHVRMTGNGSSTCIQRGPSLDPLENSNPLTISYSDFQGCGTAIKIFGMGMGAVSINNNNFFSVRDDAVNNFYSNPIDAENNYWGTTDPSEIDRLIHDRLDHPAYGEVTYAPFLTAPQTGTGPR